MVQVDDVVVKFRHLLLRLMLGKGVTASLMKILFYDENCGVRVGPCDKAPKIDMTCALHIWALQNSHCYTLSDVCFSLQIEKFVLVVDAISLSLSVLVVKF